MDFENKTFEGIHYSRFIASWVKANGHALYGMVGFRTWLKSLIINDKHIPNDVIQEICNLMGNGKLELQENAKRWISNKQLERIKKTLENTGG